MKNSKDDYYNAAFSHIYVEKAAWSHPRTKRILSHFPKASVVEIDHYKDVFCRKGQNYGLQHRAQNLILAVKTGTLIYRGSPVCQSFGNAHFYYASCMMNCIYDCEYCYLKGMYPSGNLVAFVNLEDIFSETKRLLSHHPVYLCISYDTDLSALEPVMGYLSEWEKFAGTHEHLNLEIRTKSANRSFEALKPSSKIIYAFTLSPQAVIEAYEHKTPSLAQRISCAADAMERGFPVRLCFDPMIYIKDWEKEYDAMLYSVSSKIRMEKLLDVSVGTFRISQDYLKKMRKQAPYSPIAQFPYQNETGVCQYPLRLSEQMERHMVLRLKENMPQENIFLWKEESGDFYE